MVGHVQMAWSVGMVWSVGRVGHVGIIGNVGMVGNVGMRALYVNLQSQFELRTDEETPTVCVCTTAWPLAALAYSVVDVNHVIVVDALVINWLSDSDGTVPPIQ